jgi:hypothetical protein
MMREGNRTHQIRTTKTQGRNTTMTKVSSPVTLKPEELDIVSAGDGLITVSDNNVAVPVNAAVAVAVLGDADATAVQKSLIIQS